MLIDSVQCNLHFLDTSHKVLLGIGLLVFGALGFTLNIWLLITFIKSTLLISKHYLFILAYCITCLARAVFAGFPITAISAFANKLLLTDTVCHFFAFFQLVFGIFQVLLLTGLIYERHLNIKHYIKGTEITFRRYLICLSIFWIASVLIGMCPLLGIGRFVCDMTGTTCSLDWRMVYSRSIPYNSLLITFIGIIPLIASISYLCATILKERKILMKTHHFTLTVGTKLIATYVFWIPKAVLIVYTIFGLNMPKSLLVITSLSSEVVCIIPVLCYLLYEPTIRKAMITILYKHICKRKTKRRQQPDSNVYRWSTIRD